jgi:hypothetical protein
VLTVRRTTIRRHQHQRRHRRLVELKLWKIPNFRFAFFGDTCRYSTLFRFGKISFLFWCWSIRRPTAIKILLGGAKNWPRQLDPFVIQIYGPSGLSHNLSSSLLLSVYQTSISQDWRVRANGRTGQTSIIITTTPPKIHRNININIDDGSVIRFRMTIRNTIMQDILNDMPFMLTMVFGHDDSSIQTCCR